MYDIIIFVAGLYRVQWRKPITSDLGDLTMHTAALPGTGSLLTFMLNVLENLVSMNISEETFWQRIIETFKWGYAHRTKLGDDNFVNTGTLKYKIIL